MTVAIDQQREHHARRELLAAATAFVASELPPIHEIDRLEDEVGHVIAGHPLAHVHRHTPEEIIRKLREAATLLAGG